MTEGEASGRPRHAIAISLSLALFAWPLVDGAFLTLEGKSTSPWDTAFALGVTAPFGVAIAIAVECVATGWERARWLRATLVDGRTMAAERAREDPIGAVATAAASFYAAAGAAVVAHTMGAGALARIRQPLWGAAAVLGVGCVSLLLLVLLWPAVAATLEAGLRAVGRARWATPLGPTRVAIAVVALPPLAAALLACGQALRTSQTLPVETAMGALLAATLAAASLLLRGRAAGRLRASHALLAGVVMAAAGLAAILRPETGSPLPSTWLARPSFARIALQSYRALLDFDGDRTLNVLGGGDCAPFDAARGPLVGEVPNNGVDEDCSGRDAVVEPASVARGPLQVARPTEGLVAAPTVVLVTADAVSWSHTGLGGYRRDVTPNLDAWAARATVFETTYSSASATHAAIPAMLTGALAMASPGLMPRTYTDPTRTARAPTLPELLRGRGYRSAAVLGASYFAREAWPSLAGVFDRWDTSAIEPFGARGRAKLSKVFSGPGVTERAIRILDDHRGTPLFLWAHYFDAHPPFDVPPGGATFGNDPEARYDAGLRFADEQWGALLRAIEERFAPDEVVVVFTSDHGEAFDERFPKRGHATTCRPAETRVPFVVQTSRARGERRRGLTSHLDLAPTILNLAGVEPPNSMRGETLLPSLYDGKEPEKAVVFATLWAANPDLSGPSLAATGLFTQSFAYLEHLDLGLSELIDPVRDPAALHDLSSLRPDDVEWARAVLRAELEAIGGSPEAGGPLGP